MQPRRLSPGRSTAAAASPSPSPSRQWQRSTPAHLRPSSSSPLPQRSSRAPAALPAAASSPAPLPSPPPRQSLIVGPLHTTTVTTIVRHDSRDPSPPPQRERQPRLVSSTSPSPQRRVTTSGATTAPSIAELRELRQTRSLFLCGRGLLSLQHIQHLPEMLSLRFLSVHMNAIKALEPGCLRTLRHLVELDLSANEIQEVPPGCWEGLVKLERLNLSSNLLTRLPPGAFHGLNALQWLSLGYNSLSDIGGLRSIPAAAPLTYIDLCANKIETLETVLAVLTPHRAHVRELRLETPSSIVTVSGGAEGEGKALMPSSSSVEESPARQSDSGCWRISENPLCYEPPSTREDERQRSPSISRLRLNSSTNATVALPPPPLPYVERLLDFFPHLLLVNGTSYGFDPLPALAMAAAPPGGEASSAIPPEPGTPVLSFDSTNKRAKEGVNESNSDDDSFARLLRKPLPRLPRTPSSDSTLPSTPTSTSASAPEEVKRYRSSSWRRRHRSRSEKSQGDVREEVKEEEHIPRKQSTTPQGPPSVQRHSSDEKTWEQADRAAVTQESSSLSADTAAVFCAVPIVSRSRRRHSASKPRRATLRRTPSSQLAPTSPYTAVTASAPTPLSPGHEASPKPSASSSETTAPSTHARQLAFDAETTPNKAASQKPASQLHSQALSPRSDSQGDLPRAGKPPTSGIAQATPSAGARHVKTLSAARPNASPGGISDGGDLSPPSPARSVPYTSNSHTGEGSALQLRGPPLEATGTDSTLRQANAAALQTRGEENTNSTPCTHHRLSDPTACTAQPTAEASKPPVNATVARTTAAPAAETANTSSLLSGAFVSSANATEQWKPKRVSRGTVTDAAERHLEDALAGQRQKEEELQARIEQLQEQVSLRTATVADVRRHLDLTRTQYVELQREHQQRQQLLRSQVAALKDELARRGEEEAILQRKQQAQLTRAVDGVRQEWSRRLETEKEHHAAVQAQERGHWEAEAQQRREDQAQLQQACSMKTAQLTTLERQVQAMEEEIAKLRSRGVAEQRHLQARMNCILGEADARRRLEATATSGWTQLVDWSSAHIAQQHTREMQDTVRQLQDVEAVAQSRTAAWHIWRGQYEEALEHAAREIQQLKAQVAQRTVETTSTTAVTVSPLPTGAQPLPVPLLTSNSTVTDAKDAVRLVFNERSSDLVSTPMPAAPLVAAPITGTYSSPTEPVAPQDLAHGTHGTEAIVPAPAVGDDDHTAIVTYWREMCARAEAQLRRVEAALNVATITQQSLATENTRLLHRVTALEAEHLHAVETAQTAAAQEKENLLRTLHTLRADMEKKDTALDALEAEAHAKLNEKRRRIAELEEDVESCKTQQTRTTELNMSYREQLEAAQRTISDLQKDLEKEQHRFKEEVQAQTTQLPELERQQRELSEMLATRVAQAHQYELEKKTLVHALVTAREQLLRLQEAQTSLTYANARATEQLTRQQAELEATRRQLVEAQEASRAKQKTAREMLSRLMTADAF